MEGPFGELETAGEEAGVEQESSWGIIVGGMLLRHPGGCLKVGALGPEMKIRGSFRRCCRSPDIK